MTNEEYNQKVIKIISEVEKNHLDYLNDIKFKLEIGKDLLPVFFKYDEIKFNHDIFHAWTSLNVSYTMDNDDKYSISRTLWQLIEDIDEVLEKKYECKWKVGEIDPNTLSVKATGHINSPYFYINVTLYFREASTCKVEYVEEKVTVKRAVVKC